MNRMESFSPTRVDLAGGTLDLWPIYNFLKKPPVTINMAMDVFSHAELILRDDRQVILASKDLAVEATYRSWQECVEDSRPELALLRAIVREFPVQQGFELRTRSDSPVGAGLGGSSSLCISVMKLMLQWQNLHKSVHEIVTWAHNIESRVLHTPTGTQDYYPPLQSGLLALQYGGDSIALESIDLDTAHFDACSLLVYTGKPHHSGLNNWQVLKQVIDGDRQSLACLQELADISEALLASLRADGWQRLGEFFQWEFATRKKLSPVFSSPQIEELEQMIRQEFNGSLKICGAGGGGCVLLWFAPEQKAAVKAAVEKLSFRVLNNKSFRYE